MLRIKELKCSKMFLKDLTFKDRNMKVASRNTVSINSVLFELHGSKVSRESDLRNMPNNRPVGVRSFVKNVKLFSENQHNS